jgi:hypothetical protein
MKSTEQSDAPKSPVGRFGHAMPQPNTDEQENGPKLRVRSFFNGGSIPRNIGHFKRSH